MMAKRVAKTLIAKGEGKTVMYAIDATAYGIDLSQNNAKEFQKAMERYVRVPRRANGPVTPNGRANSGKTERGYDTTLLRVWAVQNGIDVPAHGRIEQAIVDLFPGS